ncbi:MAG: ABC transporter permease [Oscillatoria sp. PMC 1051.18]|nr:ABC transporter permease [Oscillatoria sp. PMC 1050.18]MEC5030982.1 ABC transporter permease [Oscillatoria sp. PMC 1051.18]
MNYIVEHPTIVCEYLLKHLQMTTLAVLIAVLIALPLGILITKVRSLSVLVLGILGILYTIPSLALIILLVPIFGLNARAVIIAMVIYTQIILVRNISVGLNSIDPAILEAAKGMGMNAWQSWWWVEFPLILPVFLAGVRLATIVAVAIAAIGAKFNAGGLGTLLFEGVQQQNSAKIWAGAIAVAILAFSLYGGLLYLERLSRPERKMPPPARS